MFRSRPRILPGDPAASLITVSADRHPLVRLDYEAVPPAAGEMPAGISFDNEGVPRRGSLNDTVNIRADNAGPATRKFLTSWPQEDPQPMTRASWLSGLWQGTGLDLKVAAWRFELRLTASEAGELKGKFTWWRAASQANSSLIGLAGSEEVLGVYDPATGILSLQNIGVQSSGGLGGCNWYHAYVSERYAEIRHGTWGFPGALWGMWWAQKTGENSDPLDDKPKEKTGALTGEPP
jgi:hypothetical protein